MAMGLGGFVVVLMSLLGLVAGTNLSGKVLLVSMDGFRWDYLDKVSGLGNFSRLASSGVKVDYVVPVFATKTFPAHYSIATGLYEESHGVVANYMFDPEHNASFSRSSTETFWWEGGEPVWVTAVRQGKRAAVLFWPGSNIEIRGYRPTEYRDYDRSMPFPERVETAFSWFRRDKMDLVVLYFHEPDATGHTYGPDSPQVAEKVRELDSVLGLILNGLDSSDLSHVNFILTSDHGMAAIDMQDRIIDLWAEIGDRSMVQMVVEYGTVTAILPAAGREDELVAAMRQIDHVTVYRKEEVPEKFHYTHNARIMPIIVLADEGWYLSTDVTDDRNWNGKGDHGYDNGLPSMRPIFYARGPDLHVGLSAKPINQTDIYPLMCELLGIEAAPNNGSLDRTRAFLKTTVSNSAPSIVLRCIVAFVCVGLSISFL